MQKFTSTKLFKVILILSFFSLMVFLNPERIFNPIRSGFVSVMLPFQKLFYSLSIGFEGTKEFVGSIGQLKRENEILFKENQKLVADNAMLNDTKNENAMLREQLDLLPRDRYGLVASFVVSRDPNGTGNWLEIDKGSDDGIRQGMPVIISNGILIGRVQRVEAKISEVILLTNPKSTINATTTENGAKGVVKGEYGLGIILDMILQTDSIKSGDSVVTSGIGSEIPRGLYIGVVQDINSSDDHLFQQATITAPLQTSKLQMVFIIKEIKQQ